MNELNIKLLKQYSYANYLVCEYERNKTLFASDYISNFVSFGAFALFTSNGSPPSRND